ncbi:MAG: ABC transporter permease [Proteobacteria bacterium]|nr:ABC transporter permease [Pseudomonadota bacterium]
MTAERRAVALPAWATSGLLPVLNLAAAFAVSGLVVWAIGESPLEALKLLLYGAFGYGEAIGYTFYYATNFIFTGLAVSVAFKCGLFNIGGEGQAMMGGLGLAVVAIGLDGWPPALVLPAAVLGAAIFGAAWAAIPAWLQARRGSHIVITTIMFNFIAASLVSWLLVGVLKAPGSQSPESADFPEAAWLPKIHDLLAGLGIQIEGSPLNLSFLVALACAGLVWFFIERTKWGYEIRVVGGNPGAARFAGIPITRTLVLSMLIAGGLAGLMGLNELMGLQHRLIANFTMGYGFVGIAVAFMGRSHPIGIVLAAILFGALYQGGAELAFEMPTISRDLIIAVQGLVILFAGALEHLFRPQVQALFRRLGALGEAHG